jgi:hypothetical protein
MVWHPVNHSFTSTADPSPCFATVARVKLSNAGENSLQWNLNIPGLSVSALLVISAFLRRDISCYTFSILRPVSIPQAIATNLPSQNLPQRQFPLANASKVEVRSQSVNHLLCRCVCFRPGASLQDGVQPRGTSIEQSSSIGK